MAEQVIGHPARIDRSALKTNQGLIVGLTALAFVLNLPLLAGFVALVMLLGTALPAAALFQQFYHQVLKPAGILKPDLHAEAAAPHRFAQGFGGVVLGIGVVALLSGASGLGWSLVLLVTMLAAINLVFGFCAGCFVYFQLARLRRG
jgi:hypothetical protein